MTPQSLRLLFFTQSEALSINAPLSIKTTQWTEIEGCWVHGRILDAFIFEFTAFTTASEDEFCSFSSLQSLIFLLFEESTNFALDGSNDESSSNKHPTKHGGNRVVCCHHLVHCVYCCHVPCYEVEPEHSVRAAKYCANQNLWDRMQARCDTPGRREGGKTQKGPHCCSTLHGQPRRCPE